MSSHPQVALAIQLTRGWSNSKGLGGEGDPHFSLTILCSFIDHCATTIDSIAHERGRASPRLTTVIGASLNEPHTSELNSGFFMYYIYISAVCMLFR